MEPFKKLWSFKFLMVGFSPTKNHGVSTIPTPSTNSWNSRESLVSTFAHALRKEVGSWDLFEKGEEKNNKLLFHGDKEGVFFSFWGGNNCL